MDLIAATDFGDANGIQQFMLQHLAIHQQTSDALTAQFGMSFSTFGLSSPQAEGEWIAMMRSQRGPTPPSLRDWLLYHAAIHTTTYNALLPGQLPPDLSVADFSRPDQYNDWMFIHALLHDFEQQQLGLS